MVKYGDSGRAHRRQPTPTLASSNRSMPFLLYFYPHPRPSLLLRLFLSIKRKSRTSCQPIALALGHSVLVDRKNFRELVKIVQIAEDDHENFGEARVAWRASRVSASLWWDGRRRRTFEACSTFPEWVQGKNRKNTVVATQKGRLSSEKWILDRRGKLSLGCCAIRHERKQN